MTEETAENGRFSELLAVHVAGGKSIKDSAELIGCSERQAYRVASTPEFKSLVSGIRAASLDASVGEITAASVMAVRKLVTLLDDPQFGLQAAKAILVHVAPLSELGELRQRLDALEQER